MFGFLLAGDSGSSILVLEFYFFFRRLASSEVFDQIFICMTCVQFSVFLALLEAGVEEIGGETGGAAHVDEEAAVAGCEVLVGAYTGSG